MGNNYETTKKYRQSKAVQERHREQNRRYYWRHRDTIRALKNPRTRELRHRMKMTLLRKFGGRCQRCANSDWHVLQLHHVNGGGSKERASGEDNVKTYRKLLRGKRAADEFQLLCANCNVIQEYENGRWWQPTKIIPGVDAPKLATGQPIS